MRGRRLARRVLQWSIGSLLLATAAGKLLDLLGFAAILGTYRALPAFALQPAAAAVAAAELSVGTWILSGRRLREAAAGSALLHGAYAAWSAAALSRGLRLSNCGCFGIYFARPLTGWTVVEDLSLAAFSVALARLAPSGRTSA
jgi:hypothetical protein